MLAEIENEGVKAHFNRGYEPIARRGRSSATTSSATHVRVHYFEGAARAAAVRTTGLTRRFAIETVRGRIGDDLAAELISFWTTEGVLDEAAAGERLDQVVCVLRDGDGGIAGVNSVFAERVELIGGRRFWIYRSYLLPEASESGPAMIDAAFEALAAEFDPQSEDPIGLCVLIADREEMRRRPEAVWPGTSFIYAGYLPGGQQVRIAYFEGATIAEGLDVVAPDATLAADYSIEIFALQDQVSARDVLDLWERENAVPPAEAERRVGEVHLVAVHRTDGLVGISSAYLQHNRQLGMDLWYYRAFVSSEHRRGRLAQLLAMRGRDLLDGAFRERRGPARGARSPTRSRIPRSSASSTARSGSRSSSRSSVRTSAGTTSGSGTSRAAGRPTRRRRTLTTEASAYSVPTSHGKVRSGRGAGREEAGLGPRQGV